MAEWKSRIVGEGDENPGQLLANPANWRIHPHAQEQALMGILDEVGWVQRVIVNTRTGFVLDGHLRVATAISHGEKRIPVLYVDLSEEEEKKVLLTIDPLSAMAGVDSAKLEELLKEVSIESDGLRSGIEKYAKDAGVSVDGEQAVDAEAKTDVAEELNKIWKVKPGDLMQIGRHRLLCGDCTKMKDAKRLMDGERAALCVTSPPYGVGKEYEEHGVEKWRTLISAAVPIITQNSEVC